MLALNDIELKQTRFYKDVFKEGQQTGIKTGIQQGLQQGQANLLIMMLESRFGQLSSEQKEQINHFKQENFKRIFKNIWDCESLQAVFKDEK
jgi:predicted transposase YdaD